ncbi:equilibrative nucleoside transporter 3-like [Diorhabda carinulata]|uniref:equilibrative nucleoside transporter 3-like n=1 Tax=Diorhabda carinulata TaxID=1163345 RepID=UPI0025A00D1A|nr:equilibrative nucleoside transporter 3-like [Diorhabda carinulata]
MSVLDDIEISRKASILSIFSDKYEAHKKSIISEKGKEPKDILFIVHILCFFVGFMNIMPMVFFSTAQTYWMYKFRNATLDEETTSGKDRTALQSYFQSVQMVASSVPNVIFTLLALFYGHKLSAIIRSIGALAVQCTNFAIFAAFTYINTDSWQNSFFVLTMGLFTINSACTSTFHMSSVVLMAKLPSIYMFFFLIGQNGTVITTTLQIIALSVTDRSLITGAIYFTAGTILIGLTLILLLVGRITPVFKYYDVTNVKENKTEELKWSECKILIKKIWPCLVIICGLLTSSSFVMPGIITLIVSENDTEKTAWTAKYFTPVTAFLIPELVSILGRVTAKNFRITNTNKWWYIAVVIIRGVTLVPFYMFCRAEPRHLPVVFGSDWQFISIHAFFAYTMGFLLNVTFMSIRTLTDKPELGLKLLGLVASLTSAANTANGVLMVRLL